MTMTAFVSDNFESKNMTFEVRGVDPDMYNTLCDADISAGLAVLKSTFGASIICGM